MHVWCTQDKTTTVQHYCSALTVDTHCAVPYVSLRAQTDRLCTACAWQLINGAATPTYDDGSIIIIIITYVTTAFVRSRSTGNKVAKTQGNKAGQTRPTVGRNNRAGRRWRGRRRGTPRCPPQRLPQASLQPLPGGAGSSTRRRAGPQADAGRKYDVKSSKSYIGGASHAKQTTARRCATDSY